MINIRYLKVFMRNNNLDLGRQSTTDLSAFSILQSQIPIPSTPTTLFPFYFAILVVAMRKELNEQNVWPIF